MRVRAIRPGDLVETFSARCRSLGRPAWAATILGATILFVSHVSSGRQVEQETIRAKVVVAQTFLLDAAGGNSAVALGVDSAGQGLLFFQGRRTPVHLTIGNSKPGPGIALSKEETRTRMDLALSQSGSPSLRLASDVPQVDLRLAVWGDAESRITLAKQDSEVLSLFGLRGNAGTGLRLLRGKDGPRIVLSDSKKQTQASIAGQEGNVRTLIGANVVQGPAFLIYDRALENLLVLIEEADGKETIMFTDPVTRIPRSME